MPCARWSICQQRRSPFWNLSSVISTTTAVALCSFRYPKIRGSELFPWGLPRHFSKSRLVEGIQGAGPQIFIWGAGSPIDEITMNYFIFKVRTTYKSSNSTRNSGSPFSMVICVTTSHVRNTSQWQWRKMWWQKTWERIPQFFSFSRSFSVSCSCRALNLACIALCQTVEQI